ncbi:PLP-dependent transferase [Aspergillus ibericus CBS 121593]|uniref:PLP-dependent transferase n=1 Tax=Aspergillus ibericus CBS 121593 TaxID=1448316 RepID=A0A395GT08_9EURO|nr:PLP-dependent transferase [Aspergillus ibericus CBS 121593]RAK98556.1 PLP-dependent transferase [Aspergillus ibericus CBS 121593]
MAPLSPADVQTLRAGSAPLNLSVAANVSADAFKSPHTLGKPRARPMDHHFSMESAGFRGSAMKKSASVVSARKVIPLGAGRPTANYYPWNDLAFEGMRPALQSLPDESPGDAPHMQTASKEGVDYNLSLVLNYGGASGSPHLLRFITEHIEMEYTYPGALEGARQLDLHVHGIQMDREGARADDLARLLDTWDLARGLKPRLHYMIPSGQNPTGTTQSLARRREIYQVAEEHDLLVIEDDPYYFLRAGTRGEESDRNARVPSYVSLDKSGRVVRLDSTSKILAPGLRVGWQEVSTVSVTGPSQWMTWKLLDECWGHQGFLDWLDSLSLEYRFRRDILLDACNRYLPKEICSWVEPVYGMFLWICLDWQKHPRFQASIAQKDHQCQIVEIESNILLTAFFNGVQVTPDSLFGCNSALHQALHF